MCTTIHTIHNINNPQSNVWIFVLRCAPQSTDKSASRCQRSTALQFRWNLLILNETVFFDRLSRRLKNDFVTLHQLQEEKCATTYKQECHPVSHEECHPGSSCSQQLHNYLLASSGALYINQVPPLVRQFFYYLRFLHNLPHSVTLF